MTNPPKKKTVYRIINGCLTVGVIYFSFIYGSDIVRQVDFGAINWVYCLLAAVCFFMFYVVLSYHWLLACNIVETGSDSCNSRQKLAFFASQPYKYLPTSIFTFSSRAKYSKKLGMGLKSNSYAQLIENGSIVGSAILMGSLFYLLDVALAIGIVGIGVLFMTYYLIGSFAKNLRINLFGRNLSLHRLVQLGFLASASWLLAGVAFWLTALAFDGRTDIVKMIFSNAFAYAAGIIAVFAPGGVGVREAILLGSGIGAPVVVLWRLLTFTVDMVVGMGAIALLSIQGKKHV